MKTKNPKERYYALDNIGFVGTQEYRSPAQRKEDIRVASEAFRKHRAEEAAKTAANKNA